MVDETRVGIQLPPALIEPVERLRAPGEPRSVPSAEHERSLRETRVEVRTQFEPGSRRLFTDILDPSTREVLYRVPPQSVTDAVMRLSEATSRYERLMTGVAWRTQHPR